MKFFVSSKTPCAQRKETESKSNFFTRDFGVSVSCKLERGAVGISR